MVQEVMNSYATNPALLHISALAFLIGYLEYIYSFRLVLREKMAPFPIYMHTFYLAHDFTGAVVFGKLALEYEFFWFFSAASIALLIWNFFEMFNLYMAVKVERQEIWGDWHKNPVTKKQAIYHIIVQVALMFVVVNLFRVFMDDQVMFKWFAFTNILMAVAPGYLWRKRKSRDGASIGLAIVILIGTINTFLPPGYGMWTTASTFFDQPWFYITGVVVSAIAASNLIVLLKYPPKKSIDGKKVIW